MTTTHEDAAVVYIIDDDLSVRRALEDLFASIDMKAISFESVRSFLDFERQSGPSCMILDVRMPEQTGTDFFAQMTSLGIRIPVIFITGHGDITMGVNAIRNGAVDFLPKPFRDHDLLDAVYRAIDGDRKRLQDEQARSEIHDRWLSLTAGERDVFTLVVQGLLNKQIAAQLKVKEITVKVRRAHVMQKMQAGSLADLVRMSTLIES